MALDGKITQMYRSGSLKKLTDEELNALVAQSNAAIIQHTWVLENTPAGRRPCQRGYSARLKAAHQLLIVELERRRTLVPAP